METVPVDIHPDELAYLNADGRCEACGHLQALHNEHCCSFCLIPDRKCEWGKIDAPRSPATPGASWTLTDVPPL